MTPAAAPITIAGIGFTNPDAGVMATSPATAPETAPRTLGFPATNHSMAIQPNTAAAVAKWVAINALEAKGSCGHSTPGIKAEPTYPQQACANDA
jgi:hypothetical protein